MGKQTLNKVNISLVIQEYGESDSWTHLFGFRKIENYIDPLTGGRYKAMRFRNSKEAGPNNLF